MNVKMPDGTVVYFPDDFPPDQIKALIKQKFPDADKTWRGSILPFSSDASGKVGLDLGAGITGAIGSAATLPGDVMAGKVDPFSKEGRDRALGLASFATPANRTIYLGVRTKPVAAPSAEALDSAASAGYNSVRDMGVQYSSDAVGAAAKAMRAKLEADGILEELAPKTFSILKGLENPPPGSTAPIAGLEAARRALGNARKDFTNPTEQLAADRLASGLDEFIQGAPGTPGAVLEGPAAESAATLGSARGNYAAARRSDKLTGAQNEFTGVQERAELAAAVANSGGNLDNAIRQRAAAILLDPKKRAGFNEYEIAALKTVAAGTISRNSLRTFGNVLGGGGGLGMAVAGTIGATAGAFAGGPVGAGLGAAALPAAGASAKAASAVLTKKALAKVDEATRRRSPLYAEAVKNAPPQSWVMPKTQAMLARGLLSLAAPPPKPYRKPGILYDTTGKPIPPGSQIY
jgi:hypothetical protein